MVGGLTRRERPAHTRVTVTSLWIAMDTHTSTALFPFAQANTYRERLSVKGLWGQGQGGTCSRQSVPARGWAAALACLQLARVCPGLLGAGGGGWGVGKDSPWAGRHKRHVLGDRKPVTVAAATMSCVYCVDIWRREGPLPARGERGLGSGRHLLMARRALS